MSQLLKPFTQFLESIGIDPIIFGLLAMAILIFSQRDKYRHWKEQTKLQKEFLRSYIIIFLMGICAWLMIEYMP